MCVLDILVLVLPRLGLVGGRRKKRGGGEQIRFHNEVRLSTTCSYFAKECVSQIELHPENDFVEYFLDFVGEFRNRSSLDMNSDDFMVMIPMVMILER